ncbi:Mechanosensitive ion channel [Draconibacterium orientale]|uniref:Mechanosensitive ion channel n=1 Tax=Draconibacterium orientale TaxID=1168034 RepID=X5DF12_9BACT|nr:mechanosensitive ion channel domain-containing protein [Draconibacterium orientale]AHW58957.1 mechanosensitive ion channel protein MscS [Draconibacterium orientale]SET51890.1 Mechanosensitive ion channel [Draconibacterium orientale]
MEHIQKIFGTLIEPTVVLLVLIILLILNSWIFKRIKSTTSDGNITKGAIAFFLVLIGVLSFILVLPIDKALQGQILAFLGIIISAGIALSSTTVLGNMIAGIMNNSMNRFRNGDLIKIGNLHGRVIRKSIFHTEIQLEDSNFITIPNLYIANNPVKLTRKTNTVISASVSLGYDISREKIEGALRDAAKETGLSDPYVYITSLGDFSVVYKIHGFLEDSSTYFSTSSLLNAKVMDKLHAEKIEIVSPTFMNQRRVDEKEFIPKQVEELTEPVAEKSPEDLIFDEAIKSEKLVTKKDYLKDIDKKQVVLKEKLKNLKDDKEIERIKSTIKRYDEMKEHIEKSIIEQIERDKDSAK